MPPPSQHSSRPVLRTLSLALNCSLPSPPSSSPSLELLLCPLLVPSTSSLVPPFSPWRPGDAYSVDGGAGTAGQVCFHLYVCFTLLGHPEGRPLQEAS